MVCQKHLVELLVATDIKTGKLHHHPVIVVSFKVLDVSAAWFRFDLIVYSNHVRHHPQEREKVSNTRHLELLERVSGIDPS